MCSDIGSSGKKRHHQNATSKRALAMTDQPHPPQPGSDATNLAYYEAMITHGLQQTERVAEALLQIHERKLYRDGYPSFEEYLNQRWNMSKSRGYQLLRFASLKRRGAMTDTAGPENERQARALDADGQRRPQSPGRPMTRVIEYVSRAVHHQPQGERREFINRLRQLLSEMEKELDAPTQPNLDSSKMANLPNRSYPQIDHTQLVVDYELPEN